MSFRKIACLVAVLLSNGIAASAQEAFKFIAIGDVPYGRPEEVYAPYRTLIETINRRAPVLVLHVGDIKSARTHCSDRLLRDQHDFMSSIQSAVLYTPGDNEWTDCYRGPAGGFDPLDRLAFLRRTFFSDPARTLGAKPLALERQPSAMDGYATYVENARLAINGVQFVSLHVVGSNNNFETRGIEAAEEFIGRNKADLAWLADSFAKATRDGAPAVVVALHADMFEFDFNEDGKEGFLRHSGFAAIGPALAAAAKAFGKPVLLVYGDSHTFRVTRPFMKTAPNLIGLEVFGDADIHAVEVSVEPADPAVFGFRPVWNPAQAK